MRAGLPSLRFAVWLLVPGAVVSAGEPIRFSGRSDSAAPREMVERAPFLPAEARTDRVVVRPELPMETMLAPGQSVTPTIGLTRRQMEDQDRRRNWVLQSPESLQQEASKSGTDRQREGRTDQRDSDGRESAPDGKQPSGRQSNDEERPGDSTRGRNNPGPARKTDRDRPAPRPPENGQADQRTRTGWEPRSSSTLRGGPGDAGWADPGNARGGVARAMGDARDRHRDRERAASMEDFKRTFANPWAQPTGGAGLPASPSGAAMGAGPGAPGGDFRRAAAGGLTPGGRSSMELGPRGGAGDFDPKNPLNYGAPGTVLRQSESPRTMERKPILLEVPKRKF